MTEQEKMEELVDVLEMDLGEFDRDTVLEEVEHGIPWRYFLLLHL